MKHSLLIENVKTLLDYMWVDEKRHYYESECPDNHIFVILMRIRDNLGLVGYYAYHGDED